MQANKGKMLPVYFAIVAAAVLMARTMQSANRNSLYYVSILAQSVGSVFISSGGGNISMTFNPLQLIFIYSISALIIAYSVWLCVLFYCVATSKIMERVLRKVAGNGYPGIHSITL